jgi:UDP-N-acetylglucosamine 2-epimerase (non-hydrolysing)
MMKNILFLFGTRPEAIKLAPIIKRFQSEKKFNIKIGVTAQHRQMLDQVLSFFEILPDYDLNIMKPNQSLSELTSDLIKGITDKILTREKFNLVFLQGDTSTALAGALAAFYQRIDIVHIEAGLRSFDINSPFPEEANRLIVSRLAKYHFCPTQSAKDNLCNEGVFENVFVVGNSVIDALGMGLEKIRFLSQNLFIEFFKNIDFNKKIILVTCHRRESFGIPFKNICNAINEIAKCHKDFEIVYPVHLNPNIKDMVKRYLTEKNIKLIKPLDYPHFIWLLEKSYIILTDSGGIQEEAPSLGKPILVLRDVTERQEGITAGTAILVGTNTNNILYEANRLLNNSEYYTSFTKINNPYGKGNSSEEIFNIITPLMK